jgi:hypothetical protein
MTKKYLMDPAIRDAIFDCASNPDDRCKVVLTGQAAGDIIEARITVRAVCKAICVWVANGKKIEVQSAAKHPFKGQPVYIMDAMSIDGKKIYVKVQFMGEFATGSTMKIVSAHKPGKV